MNIIFNGHNLDVTPALKTFTTEKMERIEHKHHLNDVHVTFHLENITHIAEATTHLDKVDIHATAKADDMYSAIDMLVDKLTAQIKKHKEKMIDGHH